MKRSSPTELDGTQRPNIYSQFASPYKVPKMAEIALKDPVYWERTWNALDFDDGMSMLSYNTYNLSKAKSANN